MSAEVEMADQDMATIVAMERSQDQEKETLLLKVLEYLLRKKAAKRLVTDNFCDNFIKKTEQDLRDVRHMIDREKEEEEEGKLQRDAREKIRLDLIRSSGMSEEEVEGVMEKLMAQMAKVEEKMGQEQARQRRVLEERLAQRRQVMEYQEVVEAEADEARHERINAMRKLFRGRLDSGQLLERQNDELIGSYEQNLWSRGLELKKGLSISSAARQQREKQAMLQRLQERLQQRLTMASESEARDAQEQDKLCQEQTQTIQKVLASNMDLSEEAKDKVLRQHEQNMQALSNQLQRSKMRQQKSLEMKLNQRRARMLELKQKQEDLKRSKKDMNEKERQKLEEELAAQIEAEEKKLEEARQAAVSDLRRQLAAETEEALRLQDEEIGLLIGRLQDQLEKKLTAGKNIPGGHTDQLLQQHYSQVQHLNQQMQRHREAQERQLSEKIKAKQQQKEQEIESQLEEEAQEEYTVQQKRGAGYASLALMQSFLEQRHQRAITELEQEMLAELEKNRDELNRQMEIELQKELQAQRQSLLAQLAAVTNLPNNELEDAVDAAVAGGTQEDKNGSGQR
nr:hypothetical protein BaRGS_016719 [Batillaria attramentaria]